MPIFRMQGTMKSFFFFFERRDHEALKMEPWSLFAFSYMGDDNKFAIKIQGKNSYSQFVIHIFIPPIGIN